ncbi:MAG: DUF3040 domain-containing protein [Acidimicrobiia bacterium]
MPLSEHEQRILSQIEQQFYDSDPEFARGVSQNTLYRHAFRNIKWASLGLVAGLAFLLATLPIHVGISFIGFLGMLAAAFVIERNARRLGRAGWESVTKSMRSGKLRDSVGEPGDRFRSRFRRDPD